MKNKNKNIELNWIQKIMVKLNLFGKWNNFDEYNFPTLGQNIQIKIKLQIKPFSERIFISETFKWVIDDNEKQEWLNIGLSSIQWRNNKL